MQLYAVRPVLTGFPCSNRILVPSKGGLLEQCVYYAVDVKPALSMHLPEVSSFGVSQTVFPLKLVQLYLT